MSTRFARFLLFFAALWLPVQTMAAMSMPLCRHSQEQAKLAIGADQPADAMPCHEAATPDQGTHGAACDNCEICHMAGAGFMPSAALIAGLIPAEYHYVLPVIVAPPSHIAEPPQHPPRSSA